MKEESGKSQEAVASSIELSVRRLLAPGLQFRLSPISAALGALFPTERRHIAHACSKRQDEFRAGRTIARGALLDLGVPPDDLPPVPMRGPRWPDGIVGSISHSSMFAGALVAEHPPWVGLGVDIEEPARVGPELERLIMTSQECEELETLAAPLPCGHAGFLFSAKEAVYKACSQRFGIGSSFLDLQVGDIGPSSFRFRLKDAGRWTSPERQFGGWIFHAGHIVCVAGVADDL